MKSQARTLAKPVRVPTRSKDPLRIVLSDGAVEGLKWLALALMLADHVNKFLFKGTLPAAFELGRLVVPLFGFVLAYNLARPSTNQDAYLRTVKRLGFFGLLASPMYGAMVEWWSFNIMFTLLVAVIAMWLLNRGGWRYQLAALAVVAVGGAFVEFWWPAVLTCLTAWAFCKRPTLNRLALWAIAVASLGLVNHNLWALAALPVIFLAQLVEVRIPRLKWLFYAFYPAHLAVLFVLQSHHWPG